MDWFTAGVNLNHKGIIEYKNRPFTSTDEMNECIINNINTCVKPTDRLYIVGNFLFGPLDLEKYIRTLKYFRKLIACRNLYLIYGNHDRRAKRYYQEPENFAERNFLWTQAEDYIELLSPSPEGAMQSIILFTYPLETWNRRTEGAIHLHGFTYATKDDPTDKLRFDVSIDGVAKKLFKTDVATKEMYKPYSLEDILNIIESKKLN